MTGSYFRGDAEAVLAPQDEAKFDTVTYTYYEQLNGYEYLKQLDIGYFFYSGSYADDILKVLDPAEKTIIHIPNVNSRESTKDKIKEVEHIIEALGEWQGIDPVTGFQLVKTPGGRVLRIADLVDDDPAKRDRVSAALKDPAQKNNRDHVDIIIALGMAKEGFDWIWCEHALTVGYRSSLTEIVQIIGRATRDAPGKTRARFTNLIAEPDASEEAVTEAVNDTLKAIAASLLMEQVLAPRFEFKPKNPDSGPTPGFDYGEGGYDPEQMQRRLQRGDAAQFQIEIKGLAEPKSEEAARICRAGFERGDRRLRAGQDDDRARPVRRGAGARGTDAGPHGQDHQGQISRARRRGPGGRAPARDRRAQSHAARPSKSLLDRRGDGEPSANTAFIDGVRKFAMDVRELDIDLIDRINPFGEAYAILAKTMNEESLKQVQAAIAAKRTSADAGGGEGTGGARASSSRRSADGCPRSAPRTPGKSGWPKAQPPSCASRMRAAMSDLDLDELRDELADFAAARKEGRTLAARGTHHRRLRGNSAFRRTARPRPQHGEERDIFERLYAVRLDRLRALEECRSLLAPLDHQGLLAGAADCRRRADGGHGRRRIARRARGCGRRDGHHRTAPRPRQRRKTRRRGNRQPRTVRGLRDFQAPVRGRVRTTSTAACASPNRSARTLAS